MKFLIKTVLIVALFLPLGMNASTDFAGLSNDPPKKKNIVKRAFSKVKKAFGRSNNAPTRAQFQIGAPQNFKKTTHKQLGQSGQAQSSASSKSLQRTFTPPPLPGPPNFPPPNHLRQNANGRKNRLPGDDNYEKVPSQVSKRNSVNMSPLIPDNQLGNGSNSGANRNSTNLNSNKKSGSSIYGKVPNMNAPSNYSILPKQGNASNSVYGIAPPVKDQYFKPPPPVRQRSLPAAQDLKRTTSNPSIPATNGKNLNRTNSVNGINPKAKPGKLNGPIVPPAPKGGPVQGPKPPGEKMKSNPGYIPRYAPKHLHPKTAPPVQNRNGKGLVAPPAPKGNKPVRPQEPPLPTSKQIQNAKKVQGSLPASNKKVQPPITNKSKQGKSVNKNKKSIKR